MSKSSSAPHIMIIAGEASGDLHGAGLVNAMQEQCPGVSFSGMGGPEMGAAGVQLFADASKLSVMGVTEVFSHLGEIRAAMRILEAAMQTRRPALLILIDFPGFNLILAKKAKRLGIPVFYYISPKIWAWRSGRVKKIKKTVDRMAVILPFEEEFYRQYDFKVHYVGNPLLDSVKLKTGRAEFLQQQGIPPDCKVVGLLPGSRRQEISALLPVFLEVASRLAAGIDKIVFLLPLASTLDLKDLQANGLTETTVDVRVISGERYETMAACDAVIAASGTVTLELAILGVPMVVAYRLAPLTYFLGKRFIKVKYVSLVNLIAGREVVPELLQYDATAEKIGRSVQRLLDDEWSAQTMREQLAAVVEKLGQPGAADRAARLALEMIENSLPNEMIRSTI